MRRLLALALLLTAAPLVALDRPHAPYWVDGSPKLDELARAAVQYTPQALPKAELIAKGRLDPDGSVRVPQRGQATVFTTINMVSGTSEPVTAVLRAVGKHCYVYVDAGYTIDDAVIERIRDEFDETCYGRVRAYLGSEWSPGIDHDPRVTLLMLDIKDGWTPGKGYVAGYFSPIDEYSARLFPQSNEREMLYLDIFPANPESPSYMGVVAHEFAHMVHFNQDRKEDKWLNEGLAQLASYVAGYGHPGQVYAFLSQPVAPLGTWSSSVIDYGAAYLWNYYLYSKLAGDTEAQKQAFFKDLIAHKEKGIDSVRAILAKHAPTAALEDVFADWTVATYANVKGQPRFSYDDSLPLAARETVTHQDLAKPAAGKGKLEPWSAASLLFTPRKLWSPRRPTLVDRITVHSATPGVLRWSVNDGLAPPDDVIPPGTELGADGWARTLLIGPDADKQYKAVIGPMASRTMPIDSVHYAVEGDGSAAVRVIPVGVLPQDRADEPPAPPPGGRMHFELDGPSTPIFSKKMRLRAVVELTDGTVRVEEPTLASNNGSVPFLADFNRVRAVTFLPSNVGERDASFTYKTRPGAAGGAAALPPGLPTASEIKAAVRENPIALELPLAAPDSPLYQGALSALGVDGGALRWFVTVASRLDPVQKGHLTGFLRDLLRVAHANIASGTLAVEPQVLADLQRILKEVVFDGSGGPDTSHSNIPYLISKKREIIAALKRPQLDPYGIEGTILGALKVFAALGTIPNIPLPNGLSPRGYDEDAAIALMDAWSTGNVTAAQEEERRQVLYRLLLAEGIVEFSHNAGLVLADDMLVSLYRLVNFVDVARGVTEILAMKAQGVPIVGKLLERIKWIISSQLLSLVARLTRYVAERLPSPYGGVVQYGAQVLFWAYAQAKQLTLDYWDGWVVEYVVKLVGKAVLVSLPKIGYVSIGQHAVDAASTFATQMVHEGTLAQAQMRLAQDYPRIVAEVTTRHQRALTGLQAADIVGRISDVTRIGILLDPTRITTVVSIATSVITGGILAHAMYTSGRYFFGLPLADTRHAVAAIFKPITTPGHGAAEVLAVPVRTPTAAAARTVLEGWRAAVAESRAIYAKHAKGAALADLEKDAERLIALEPALADLAHALDGLTLAQLRGRPAGDGDAPSADDQALASAIESDLTRVAGLAALATLPLSQGPSRDGALRAIAASATALDALESRLVAAAARAASGVPGALVLLHGTTVKRTSSGWTVTVKATNALNAPADAVVVELETAYNVKIGKRTLALGRLAAGEERTLRFDIDRAGETHDPVPLRLHATVGGERAGESALEVHR